MTPHPRPRRLRLLPRRTNDVPAAAVFCPSTASSAAAPSVPRPPPAGRLRSNPWRDGRRTSSSTLVAVSQRGRCCSSIARVHRYSQVREGTERWQAARVLRSVLLQCPAARSRLIPSAPTARNDAASIFRQPSRVPS